MSPTVALTGHLRVIDTPCRCCSRNINNADDRLTKPRRHTGGLGGREKSGPTFAVFSDFRGKVYEEFLIAFKVKSKCVFVPTGQQSPVSTATDCQAVLSHLYLYTPYFHRRFSQTTNQDVILLNTT